MRRLCGLVNWAQGWELEGLSFIPGSTIVTLSNSLLGPAPIEIDGKFQLTLMGAESGS